MTTLISCQNVKYVAIRSRKIVPNAQLSAFRKILVTKPFSVSQTRWTLTAIALRVATIPHDIAFGVDTR